jgi:hypothetical protein
MSAAEIKKTRSNLVTRIGQLSDSSMLVFLDSLPNKDLNDDWWADLSESTVKHINEGIQDEKMGRAISSNEFWDNLKNA